jgi:hypothetical protein
MLKITKRNILFFILGLLSYFIIDIIWNWNDSVRDFKEGFKEGYEDVRK